MAETFVFETLIHLIRHQVTPYYAKNSKINFTFFTKFLYHKTLCYIVTSSKMELITWVNTRCAKNQTWFEWNNIVCDKLLTNFTGSPSWVSTVAEKKKDARPKDGEENFPLSGYLAGRFSAARENIISTFCLKEGVKSFQFYLAQTVKNVLYFLFFFLFLSFLDITVNK